MNKILITGATGNVGMEVIRYLQLQNTSDKIVVGARNTEKARNAFKDKEGLEFVHFDFEDASTFDTAFTDINKVFLLRPPHISDISRYFTPLIDSIKTQNINGVVFLSVQGAEKSKVIPHNKIEKLIQNAGTDYIFLRPSYFMQNLTTSLHKDIKEKREIILPAGKAKFNWVDIKDIGEAAAILLDNFENYKNQAYEITGLENRDFGDVTDLINQNIEDTIRYRPVNPVKFYRIKKREGMAKGMIIVMIMLHVLPRFQKQPEISGFYEKLTGKQPTDLKTFIQRERHHFVKSE